MRPTATVESSAGAAATIIEIWNAAAVVGLHAAGAVFGKRDKGFTPCGPGIGISILVDDVTVQGNHVAVADRGILVDREKGDDPTLAAGIRVLENVVTGSARSGILVRVSGVAVSGNVIQGCAEGIRVEGNGTVIGDNHRHDADVEQLREQRRAPRPARGPQLRRGAIDTAPSLTRAVTIANQAGR